VTEHKASQILASPRAAIEGLEIGYAGARGPIRILHGVDLALEPGECLGIVGESGCGKSTLLYAMIGHTKPGFEVLAGHSRLDGSDLFSLPPRELRAARGRRVALVPQSSGHTLTPHLRIVTQLEEAMESASRSTREWGRPGPLRARASRLLERAGLADPARLLDRYPHQLSGGQLQRVAIALAIAGEPDLLLLDEPTSGLDKTTQTSLLECLRSLLDGGELSIVCVSHDLDVVQSIADRVAILYAGQIVETGPKDALFEAPSHPYTQELLASRPSVLADARPLSLPGRLPAPGELRDGCAFANRCPRVEAQCRTVTPPALRLEGRIEVRCHFPGDLPRSARATRGAFHREIDAAPPLLTVEGLATDYGGQSVLEGITLGLRFGETLAVVGESGSGKSTLLRAISGLLRPSAGEVRLHSAARDLPPTTLEPNVEGRQLETLRRIQFVFQNPRSSLNPRHTVSQILSRPLQLYWNWSPKRRRDRVAELLDSVRLDRGYLDRLPSQLSGGEQQRVAIARAFAAEPDLLLCDEVTSALDVSVRASVIELLERLREERGTAYLLVSHELDVVRTFADRVAVLHQGRIVETGRTSDIFDSPEHPYTGQLLAPERFQERPGVRLDLSRTRSARPPGGRGGA
jgi:peptide/nickel transport system ATP-binding protein